MQKATEMDMTQFFMSKVSALLFMTIKQLTISLKYSN